MKNKWVWIEEEDAGQCHLLGLVLPLFTGDRLLLSTQTQSRAFGGGGGVPSVSGPPGFCWRRRRYAREYWRLQYLNRYFSVGSCTGYTGDHLPRASGPPGFCWRCHCRRHRYAGEYQELQYLSGLFSIGLYR